MGPRALATSCLRRQLHLCYIQQNENRVLTKKDYWRTAVVCVFCHACLWAIAFESPWDAAAVRVGLSGFRRDILSDIFRAALLEEFFRFTGLLVRSVY